MEVVPCPTLQLVITPLPTMDKHLGPPDDFSRLVWRPIPAWDHTYVSSLSAFELSKDSHNIAQWSGEQSYMGKQTVQQENKKGLHKNLRLTENANAISSSTLRAGDITEYRQSNHFYLCKYTRKPESQFPGRKDSLCCFRSPIGHSFMNRKPGSTELLLEIANYLFFFAGKIANYLSDESL